MTVRPRKAYRVELTGQVVKTAIVWADNIPDAKRRFLEEQPDSGNVEVIDNEFHEGRLRRPRREPSEDR